MRLHEYAKQSRVRSFAALLETPEWKEWEKEVLGNTLFTRWRDHHAKAMRYAEAGRWNGAFYHIGSALSEFEWEMLEAHNAKKNFDSVFDLLSYQDDVVEEQLAAALRLAAYLTLLKCHFALKPLRGDYRGMARDHLQKIEEYPRPRLRLRLSGSAEALVGRGTSLLLKELENLAPRLEFSL